MNTSLITTKDVHELLSKYLDAFNKNKFEENLHLFIESAIDRDDYSFNTGLLGAGWLISFFHKHEVFDGDIDEVLADFDDNFYKLSIKTIVDVNSPLEDVLNLIHYFQQRIQNKPLKHNFYRRFALFETIKLLIEKLNSILKNNSLNTYEEIEVMLKFSYLFQTCNNEKEIEEIYYSKTNELIEKFRTLPELSSENLYYLHLLQLSCIIYNNPFWVNEIEKIFTSINGSPNTKLINKLKDLNNKLLNILDVKINLSPYNVEEKRDLLILLATNLKCIELIDK